MCGNEGFVEMVGWLVGWLVVVVMVESLSIVVGHGGGGR